MSKCFTYQALVPVGFIDEGIDPELWPLKVLAQGKDSVLRRPCIDCGVPSSCFCSGCFAEKRLPGQEWAKDQRTPLCPTCDARWGHCHFCREERSTAASRDQAPFSGFTGLNRGFFTQNKDARKRRPDAAKAEGAGPPQEAGGEEIRIRFLRELSSGSMGKAPPTKVHRCQAD